ncbi:hypothetical protein BK816_06020 [Boudabousia tangfeifanii]|uniref:YibE/F family protein n=1 Tax=Boudabousia tangfeifanii TaxID=1912795 RepID=A0A1D9MKU1_9ACTO|nr:YibE/F family protein [Boudabousia tangfeifanii]AOZ72902.1 hypothetical protein BK816_06020 [Boudabousia tangfeifanii]
MTVHSHDHSAPVVLSRGGARRIRFLLSALVIPLCVLTIAGLIWLWPGANAQVGSQPLLAPGSAQVLVKVDRNLAPTECLPPNTEAEARATTVCATVEQAVNSSKKTEETVKTPDPGTVVAVHIPPEFMAAIRTGQVLRTLYTPAPLDNADLPAPASQNALDQQNGGNQAASEPSIGAQFFYLDVERSFPLSALVIVYLVVVVAVARKRGFLAVLGLTLSVLVVWKFVVPALMTGNHPLLVTIVGVSAMILSSVYVAHGVSIKTTTALLGTYFGLALTCALAVNQTRLLGLMGAGEEFQNIHASFPAVSLPALLTCGMVIAGLGALNDVTITQSSTVWELFAANPAQNRWEVYRSAMRVGRDHIASTVYTLAFAYVGTALPTLMLVMLVDRPLGQVLSSGQIAEELGRTLVASIGLVLAIPLTTAIGALLVPVGFEATTTMAKTSEPSEGNQAEQPSITEADIKATSIGQNSSYAQPDLEHNRQVRSDEARKNVALENIGEESVRSKKMTFPSRQRKKQIENKEQ